MKLNILAWSKGKLEDLAPLASSFTIVCNTEHSCYTVTLVLGHFFNIEKLKKSKLRLIYDNIQEFVHSWAGKKA